MDVLVRIHTRTAPLTNKQTWKTWETWETWETLGGKTYINLTCYRRSSSTARPPARVDHDASLRYDANNLIENAEITGEYLQDGIKLVAQGSAGQGAQLRHHFGHFGHFSAPCHTPHP